MKRIPHVVSCGGLEYFFLQVIIYLAFWTLYNSNLLTIWKYLFEEFFVFLIFFCSFFRELWELFILFEVTVTENPLSKLHRNDRPCSVCLNLEGNFSLEVEQTRQSFHSIHYPGLLRLDLHDGLLFSFRNVQRDIVQSEGSEGPAHDGGGPTTVLLTDMNRFCGLAVTWPHVAGEALHVASLTSRSSVTTKHHGSTILLVTHHSTRFGRNKNI